MDSTTCNQSDAEIVPGRMKINNGPRHAARLWRFPTRRRRRGFQAGEDSVRFLGIVFFKIKRTLLYAWKERSVRLWIRCEIWTDMNRKSRLKLSEYRSRREDFGLAWTAGNSVILEEILLGWMLGVLGDFIHLNRKRDLLEKLTFGDRIEDIVIYRYRRSNWTIFWLFAHNSWRNQSLQKWKSGDFLIHLEILHWEKNIIITWRGIITVIYD